MNNACQKLFKAAEAIENGRPVSAGHSLSYRKPNCDMSGQLANAFNLARVVMNAMYGAGARHSEIQDAERAIVGADSYASAVAAANGYVDLVNA